ncbi:MAG: hemerythrin domain-containing protein [Actinomycetes bacterium]
MSMNTAIHAAFRRDLNRFVDALDRFPAGNRTRAAQLAAAWANFDDQLTHHHKGEHEIAWPHLRALGMSDELLAAMDSEHDEMAAALAKARSAMGALAASASGPDAEAAKSAVITLQAATVKHLDHEEAEFEPVYLSQKNSAEMQAMGKEFAKVSPSRGGRFFAWVTDGATEEEKQTVTGNVPAPVLAVIGGIFGRGYRKNIAPIWRS